MLELDCGVTRRVLIYSLRKRRPMLAESPAIIGSSRFAAFQIAPRRNLCVLELH